MGIDCAEAEDNYLLKMGKCICEGKTTGRGKTEEG